MSGAAVACLVVAAALLGLPAPPPRRGRRLAALPIPADYRPAGAGVAARCRPPGLAGRVPARLRHRRVVAAATAGITTALLLGGWFGILAGAAVALVAEHGLRRLEPAAAGERRARAEATALPLAADLLAVALRAGMPADRAVAAVASALPGPLGDRLARVGRVLSLGGTPAQAWSQLEPVPGADRLASACIRSAQHGGALAGALGRLADDLRADRAAATEAAARRAAVLIVLPLGLCFLPAFVLAGLVPVIIAVLGDVLPM